MTKQHHRVQTVLTISIITSFVLASTARAAEADPRRPAAIEAREVPVVPAELVARLAQYQSVRGAAFRGFAPDGNGILIGTRFGNSSQLHRVYQPGGRREQITFFDEPVSGSFLPKATDGAILMLMDAGGNENDQVYLLDRQKFATTRLTDGKSRNKLGAVRPDGSQIVVTSNQRNGRDVDLYLADPRQPDSMKLLMQVDQQTWSVHDWSRDGKTLLLNRYVSANESYPALLDVASGQRTDLPSPVQDQAAFGPMAFAADGKSALIATDAGGEFHRLARLDLASLKYTWLTDDIHWDVSDIAVDPVSGGVAFIVNEDGASRLFLLSNVDGMRRDLKLPLGIVSGLEFSPDGQRLGFTLARPDSPPDAYSLSLSDHALTRWTFSEVGGLNPESFVAPSRIQFKSFDERMIPAYYFQPRVADATLSHSAAPSSLPPLGGEGRGRGANAAAASSKAPLPNPPRRGEGTDRFPVFISIHGGPESQYQPFFSPIIQYHLNELGIAVICPNVRGSSGYGKTYLALDNAEQREASVQDIGALLDWIAQQPELDSSRVVVSGGSYGGYMVLASLTHFGDRIKAGIDIVGIANFVTFLERTAPYRVDLRRAEYGDERDPAMRAVFDRISPLNNAEKIRSALMVVHGRNDPRVPFFEAEQIAAKVRASGKPVWTLFANNEGHGFAKKDNSDYQRAVEVLFLKQHLGIK